MSEQMHCKYQLLSQGTLPFLGFSMSYCVSQIFKVHHEH